MKEGVSMNYDLFQMIILDHQTEGDITDVVNNRIAGKFLAEMAGYDLEYYFVGLVSTAMQTLAHNLREIKIAEAFGVQHTNQVSIKKLLDEKKAN